MSSLRRFCAKPQGARSRGRLCGPQSSYQVGQTRLARRFDGLVATIIEMHERDRLTVLMDLLNRPVKGKVEEMQVAPI